MARLRATAATLRELLRDFETDRWSGPECAEIAEELARVEKACAVARVRAAARAINAGDVEWVARSVGSTPGAARVELSTLTAAARCRATTDAVATGAVSLEQARESSYENLEPKCGPHHWAKPNGTARPDCSAVCAMSAARPTDRGGHRRVLRAMAHKGQAADSGPREIVTIAGCRALPGRRSR